LPDAHRLMYGKALSGLAFWISREHSSALYGKYEVTLNELKAVLKVSVQAGQSDAVNKTSVESTTHDADFQEVKRRKRLISQTAKKSTKPILTTGAENTLPELETRGKADKLPATVMTSTTNLIRL
jgi:hypothetical protein